MGGRGELVGLGCLQRGSWRAPGLGVRPAGEARAPPSGQGAALRRLLGTQSGSQLPYSLSGQPGATSRWSHLSACPSSSAPPPPPNAPGPPEPKIAVSMIERVKVEGVVSRQRWSWGGHLWPLEGNIASFYLHL